jgi:hypothetical protein
MNRWSALAVAVSLLAAGCSKDTPTAPSATQPKFTATLSGNNENPPIAGAEAGGTGNITFNTTFVGGQITAATADFSVSIASLPAGTPIRLSHIHEGATGVNGGVRVDLALAGDNIVLANGSGSFTKNGITMTPELAQAIMNNPAGYYFNSHSVINGGGVVRGQLVRTQ